MMQRAATADAFVPEAAQGRAGTDGAGAPAVDLVHLSRQTMGDKELEVELLCLFARQARSIVQALSAPSAKPGHLLHTLCGSARAVGSWTIASEAQSLERDLDAPAGASRLSGADRSRLMTLGENVERVCASIDRLLDERS